MKHYSLVCFFAILSLFFWSCKRGQTVISESSKKEVVKSIFAQHYPEFNPGDLKERLKEVVSTDSIIAPFYAHTSYTPIWVHDTLDTKNLAELIELLNDVDKHGLSNDCFTSTEIAAITDSISSKLYGEDLNTIYSKIIHLEQSATKAVAKYVTGMRFGFLNPKDIYGKKLYDIDLLKPDSTYTVSLYEEMKENPIKAMLESHPTDSIYRKLQEEYSRLANLSDTMFQRIVMGSSNYRLGSKGKNISAIANRLILTGEYTPDPNSRDSLHSELNEELLAAINLFRIRNSYLEEKEVGLLTINALNRPIEYYLNTIKANMERYRWKRSKQEHDKHIEVNVPAFMLVASDKRNDSLLLISRVCVGSIRNKTPLMTSDLAYMNLNPTWNIPSSIAKTEVAVLQKKDPTYIKRKNMKLYKGGKEVDPESIDWSKINTSKFSYIVRQQPGPSNSLGLIKFMFNNSFSVYLHDTPSKATFNRKNRAVSHGCIRVQKPFDLAVFAMYPVAEIYKDRLLYSVGMSVETKEAKKLLKEEKLKKLPDIINIPADNKISLAIDYRTAFCYPKDKALYYADDIYEYDELILEELDKI
ncbi:L,D-transpeptidase family protein [Dysgonomonas sp. Marseille-P4361]|uniref:L,D-transpeptidase family protein n=1 Tax=Dysgonomonas sp. Marseille-P4361 TaxID=2161820 RepID=UPI000D558FB3|nr:L,D-transpeptidase family protein [Dysgonomonas sp. Marseille-P4361]